MLMRRPDQRGRVWWAARPGSIDLVDTRKSRIVTALARHESLTTSQLCGAFGERNSARSYKVLQYYRDQGLLETVESAPGTEVRWKLRADDDGS